MRDNRTRRRPDEAPWTSRILVLALLVVALGLLVPQTALADRDPTPEEQTRIEAQLRDLGFTEWDEIELDDDGYWEVDDASGADGEEYELKLDPQTLEVIEQEED